MSRSLKKGPYIEVKLEKRILAMNESGKKNVVKTWSRASMIWPFITEISLFLFTLPRTWLDTSWVSSLPHASSVVTLVTRRSKQVSIVKIRVII